VGAGAGAGAGAGGTAQERLDAARENFARFEDQQRRRQERVEAGDEGAELDEEEEEQEQLQLQQQLATLTMLHQQLTQQHAGSRSPPAEQGLEDGMTAAARRASATAAAVGGGGGVFRRQSGAGAPPPGGISYTAVQNVRDILARGQDGAGGAAGAGGGGALAMARAEPLRGAEATAAAFGAQPGTPTPPPSPPPSPPSTPPGGRARAPPERQLSARSSRLEL
jgi:hypothetical protein